VPRKGYSTVRTDPSQWVEISVPAIVSEGLFQLVQEQLAENRKFAIINMSWPRTPDARWYVNYGIALVGAIVILVGVLYMTLFRPYEKGRAPASDAWKNR